MSSQKAREAARVQIEQWVEQLKERAQELQEAAKPEAMLPEKAQDLSLKCMALAGRFMELLAQWEAEEGPRIDETQEIIRALREPQE